MEGEDRMKAALKASAEDDDNQQPQPAKRCPRCNSDNTKFCYYNNYSQSQPRHFCKDCRRYWTHGGALRNIPVGGSVRRYKRPRQDEPPPTTIAPNQLIVPSSSLLQSFSRPPAASPYYFPAPIQTGGVYSSLVALHSLNHDPFETLWANNYLHGFSFMGQKPYGSTPAILPLRDGADDLWSTSGGIGGPGRVEPQVAGDESDDVKPELPGDTDAGAGGSNDNLKSLKN